MEWLPVNLNDVLCSKCLHLYGNYFKNDYNYTFVPNLYLNLENNLQRFSSGTCSES